MTENITITKKIILWIAANFFIYNVMFPLLFLLWRDAETPDEEMFDETT